MELSRILGLLAATALLFTLACTSAPTPEPADAAGPGPAEASASEVPPAEAEMDEGSPGEAPAAEAEPCAGGVGFDDGTVETGYGFVLQALDGVYLQRLDAGDLPSRELEKVCLCWLKTKYSDDAAFEIVFYRDAGGVPEPEPYAKVPGVAREVPRSVDEAGRFYEFDVSGVTLPEGVSYVGAHWNPNANKYLFVCVDQSESAVEPVPVFFKEDQATGWTSVFDSRDPIFRGHRALLLRVTAAEPSEEPMNGGR
jgi:hypothetical protein